VNERNFLLLFTDEVFNISEVVDLLKEMLVNGRSCVLMLCDRIISSTISTQFHLKCRWSCVCVCVNMRRVISKRDTLSLGIMSNNAR